MLFTRSSLSLSLSCKKCMNFTRARKSETAVILSRFLVKDLALRFFPLSCFRKKARGQNDGNFPGALRIASVAIALCCVFATAAFANDIQVQGFALSDQNTGADTIKIPFNISWKNSWNDGSGNYDAAWVFAKYCTSDCQDGGTGEWKHVTLKTAGPNPSGFVQGSGTAINIKVPTDKKGAFIQRSGSGTGTLSTTGIKFVWDYGTDISDSGKDTIVVAPGTTVRIFAIEMVFIPTGAFSAGDGSNLYASFRQGASDYDPWAITSEGAITTTVGGTSNGFNYFSGGQPGEDSTNSVFTIPAAFPKGYGYFYLMKYQISQGQYVRFLNTLTRTQQGNRVASSISGVTVTNNFVMSDTTTADYRNTIQCPTTGNGTSPTRVVFNTGGRDSRVANYLSWPDLMAYADWAALRPITELEFEKAARGPNAAVVGEYAWGSTSITQCSALSGAEDGTETCTTTNANCMYQPNTITGGDGGQGYFRVGIFATGASSRVQAGAGYYGNLDLSGSVFERTVTVGNSTGRAFTGGHGDGVLNMYGYADVDYWPGNDGGGGAGGRVTGAAGSGNRGGIWYSNSGSARTSNRTAAAFVNYYRHFNNGERVGRTAF